MNFYKNIFVFFFCLVGSLNVLAEARVDPLKAFLNDLKTLQSDFTQTLLNEDGEPLEKTSGTVYLQPPGKFHWSYKKPYIQKIISNGEILWIYDKDMEQLTIKKINSEAIEKTPAVIILGNPNLEKHFIQNYLGSIEDFEWIELRPKDREAQYKNIRLGFDKRRLGMMIIADNLGQTTRIDFKDMSKNSGLSQDLFNFEIPPGVDVIDERQVNE